MKTKTKSPKFIVAIIIAFLSFANLVHLNPTPVHAVDHYNICEQDDVPNEVKKANGCDGGADSNLSNVIVNIINGIIGVLGIVAAIFILVGGINYMTSAGDVSNIEKAKKTILYAVIGLIIAVLTFAIVNFVIGIIS